MIRALAPPRSLAATLAAESGVEIDAAGSASAAALAIQLRAVEAGHEREHAVLCGRLLVDALVSHASELCESFQAAADELMRVEVAAVRASRLDGATLSGLASCRLGWRGKALTARAAADAALAAAAALACYVLEANAGRAAAAALNLTNWMSSNRNWHQDSYLNQPEVGGYYGAVWIALGDTHPNKGPFQWISGSHRWPMLSGDKVRDTLPEADRDRRSESGAWIWPTLTQDMLAAVVDREIERRGTPVRTLLAEMGDLLVWHSRLMHRGSAAAVPFMERRSLIAHYSVICRRADMFAELDENGYVYFPLKDPQVWAVQEGSQITMRSQAYVEPSLRARDEEVPAA